MATMIPPVIPRDCPSHGEIEVFLRLREDPATADWVVLHSLALAEHEHQVAGEIDFVVVVPGHGVLCLEVKGCSTAHLRRSGGVWFYGPGDKGDLRGPFKQAADGMHSLRRRLLKLHESLGGVHFASGVIFPFAMFSERSIEWQPWEVIDSRAFRSAPFSRLLLQLLKAARSHAEASENRPWLAPGAPTPEQCQLLREILRADFDVPVDARARGTALEHELVRYTSEQFVALDAMQDNSRTIFRGPAGTGKTFLAIEAARRSRDLGKRVLLVCYNSLLGSWLEQQVAHLGPEVVAGTLHRRMLQVSGLGSAPANAGEGFWNEQLPERATTKLLEIADEPECIQVFDELIVDEAQDLLRPSYLDFLDFSFKGGITAGTWRMFGDFENQSIYGSSCMSLEEFRSSRASGVPIYSLGVNCRNTPGIAEWVHLLAGLSPRYQRVLRPDDGTIPSIQFYGDSVEQGKLLISTLESLYKEGERGQDIVVLSPRADRHSAASSVEISPWKDRLRPASTNAGGRIRYSSIHAYKGLEAPTVVVTDVETIGTPEAKALFYVALTRSVQRLIILAHERVRHEALATLAGSPPILPR